MQVDLLTWRSSRAEGQTRQLTVFHRLSLSLFRRNGGRGPVSATRSICGALGDSGFTFGCCHRGGGSSWSPCSAEPGQVARICRNPIVRHGCSCALR